MSEQIVARAEKLRRSYGHGPAQVHALLESAR
jgi:hypothetical protein